MRTPEQFAKTYQDAQWYVNFHNREVWIVPMDDGYSISIFKPEAQTLPIGTCAIFFDTKMNEIGRVKFTAEF